MAMNFYEHQDRARRRTGWLLGLFAGAVLLTTVALNGVAYLAYLLLTDHAMNIRGWLAAPYWLWLSAAVLGLTAGASLWTVFKLRSGGAALADMLGARLSQGRPEHVGERRLRNVVEEMSLAAGLPLPTLYILDRESGINAFVAGLRPTETVMVVTRGALEHLDRNQLQGVVAHEFSHVFNGDMRLNMRLMGVLSGLLAIGQIGRFVMRSGRRAGKNAGPLLLLGFMVVLVGYAGFFSGMLIKAAVSRQREFLADASAVQFTRLPEGLAGALLQIRGLSTGSMLDHRRAEDVSHFCFSAPIKTALAAWTATHPPLEQRIRAIDPGLLQRETTARGHEFAREAADTHEPQMAATAIPERLGAAEIALAAGTLDSNQMRLVGATQSALPQELLRAAHDSSAAASLILTLIRHGDAAPAMTDAAVARGGAPSEKCALTTDPLDMAQRLYLFQPALTELKRLPAAARAQFLAELDAELTAEKRLGTFELTLCFILQDHLGASAGRTVKPRHFAFDTVRDELRAVLSAMAWAGADERDAAAAAFSRAWAPFGFAGELIPGDVIAGPRFSHALDQLLHLVPLLQRNVVQACADCVLHDGQVTAKERALLQAVGMALDCPIPALETRVARGGV